MSNVPQNSAHIVPKQFFCPISKEFMNDPVISPSTNRSYNRKSLVALRQRTLRINPHDGVLLPANETVLPDHDLRRSIAAWRREYSLAPPFSFSTSTDLKAPVNALLDRELGGRNLLRFLREFSAAIQDKHKIIESKEGFLLLTKLIAGCPLESVADLCQWTQISVGILANAQNFNNEIDLGEDQHKLLAVLDKVSSEINDANFQLGLINLIHSLMAAKEQILNHKGLVRTLSNFILKPGHRRSVSNEHFEKLLYIILELWGTQGGFRYPPLSRAVASIVWPMPVNINETQYGHLFQTISSKLKTLVEGQTPPSSLPSLLEDMTHADLVTRIFLVLNYATLSHVEKLSNPDGWTRRGELASPGAEELVFMRCFEILEYLSTTKIGRLEIVKVISRSGYRYLLTFCSALWRNNLPGQKESHVIPAISMIFNVLNNAKYTSLLKRMGENNYQKLLGLAKDGHHRVCEIAAQIFRTYSKIERDESVPPLQNY